jgi:UPF0755 protein
MATLFYQRPGPLTSSQSLIIPKGASVRQMARLLESAGVVESGWCFEAAARWRNDAGRLQAGEYAFEPGISLRATLDLLASGKTVIRRLTVPEGWTSWQIIELLKNEAALAGEVLQLPPDGSLLPETYHFSHGEQRQRLVGRMQQDRDQALVGLWQTRAADLPLGSMQEAIILASIVEKETGVANERARVAGVFVNRLRLGMRLQSDPTVIYALSEGRGLLGRPLTRADWNVPSPYNTYVIDGMPPNPIANPGLDAIKAVLNPERHDYLYFVADGTGGHAFARTLEEHNRHVARWRAVRDAP